MGTVAQAIARAQALEAALRHGPAAEALLAATIAAGFSPEVAAAGLEAELASWQAEDLASLLGEIGPERPRAVLILAARTLPASAMRQVLLARALGARAHLKAASGQADLAAALALADPEVVPVVLRAGDAEALAREVARVDAVVVLGSDETVAAVAPFARGKAFAAHGHKVSAAVVTRAATADEVRALARDVLAWDQAGCLAPQVIWAASPELARALAEALAALEGELPLAAAKGVEHQLARREMKTLAMMLGGSAFTTATAAVATRPDSALRGAPGPRCVWVLPWDPAALAEARPVLSSVALVGEVAPELLAGVRVCAAGELQRPTLAWRQDDLHPLASLLP